MENIKETKQHLLNVMATIDDMMSKPSYDVDWKAIETLMKKRDELLDKLKEAGAIDKIEDQVNHDLPNHDPVNHPSHYTYGSIECIDYLDAIGIGEPFCRGNVIKYTTRLGHKVDDLEDAKKVVWYAQHIVDKIADGTYKR